MVCVELQKLRLRYERTVLVWAYYAFPVSGDVLQFPGQHAQLRYEATVARNKAARHLSAQKGTCLLSRNK
jgi:hypothetical protein